MNKNVLIVGFQGFISDIVTEPDVVLSTITSPDRNATGSLESAP